jgi:UDP-glucose 4-epimerase
MRIAVTGGAGYIGSHTCTLLLAAGHDVLIIDNFNNSKSDVLDRIEKVAGVRPRINQTDITQADALSAVFSDYRPDAVLHFAGLKAVGEAVENPLEYYRVNVGGSVSLFQAMENVGCNKIVFSSSATVYGDPDQVPIVENHPLRPTNPYGQSKRYVEKILEDWGQANSNLAAVNLRYFNPFGAHPTALLGENPQGIPNNLMPYVAQVATGQAAELLVFGDDYDTPDGTGVRDYIHVMDLAAAHLKALDLTVRKAGVKAINVGTGDGYSVMQMINAFKRASNREIPYRVVDRRPGDIAECVADPSFAFELLGWKSELGLERMCADAWSYQNSLK